MSTSVNSIPALLAHWYATQSSIRRLWAIDERDSRISVFVMLEPTFDGDDALPIWLAKSAEWANELRVLTHCEVRLKLIASGAFEQSHIDTSAPRIAELNWRDPWV